MKQKIQSLHTTDENGNPTGGHSFGTGISITWQNGPLGRGENRREPNGAFVEGVLEAARDRIAFYQSANGGKFACDTNAEALDHIEKAMAALERRTAEREARAVEGTHTA